MILPGQALMPVIRDALSRGQRVRMTVTGSSMWPLLRDNDVVELEPTPAPRLGDMVLVQTNPQGAADRYALHRVVRVHGSETFFVRGDAQPHPEGPFALPALLGRVTTVWHNGCARDQQRGRWRLVGLIWIRCSRFALEPLRLAARIRRGGGRMVRGLHRFPACRACVKLLRPAYAVLEANPDDLAALYARLAPNRAEALSALGESANPNLTNFVAKHGEQRFGLVRLMRHPETDFPRTGHWLYSLTVRTRYRGMGVGEALTQRVIDQSRYEGAAALCLDVYEDNAPALALYGKLGFERVVLPAVEDELVADVATSGRRRVTLRKTLA